MTILSFLFSHFDRMSEEWNMTEPNVRSVCVCARGECVKCHLLASECVCVYGEYYWYWKKLWFVSVQLDFYEWCCWETSVFKTLGHSNKICFKIYFVCFVLFQCNFIHFMPSSIQYVYFVCMLRATEQMLFPNVINKLCTTANELTGHFFQ